MAFYEGSFTVSSTETIQPFTLEQVGFPPGIVHLTIETQNVRYRYGGGDPTTTDGHLYLAGVDYVFDKATDIQRMKFRAVTGTATVQFTVKGK